MSTKGAIKFRLTFSGGTELVENLEKLSQAISRKVQREGLMDAAEPMRDAMSRHAPRRPGAGGGRLKEDMTISPARGIDEQEVAVAVGPSKEAFYGSFDEFGTASAPAQPFARPGFDESVTASLEIFAAAVWRELAARGVARTVDAPSTPTSPTGGDLV